MNNKILIILVTLLSFSLTKVVHATEFVYPAKGQSEEQQSKDKWQCHQWATSQTGVDPEKMLQQAYQPQTPPVDDPVGMGLLKRLRMHKQLKEKQEFMSQQLAADKQRLNSYDGAYAACLKGRGYSVAE